MADFNYIFTNTIGKIVTTGTGIFNESCDPSKIAIRNVQDNFDMKASLTDEASYKYINKNGIYLDEELVDRINYEVVFGSYFPVKFSNGRRNDLNLSYKFTSNDNMITFNPGLLISNTYLLSNIVSENNEKVDIKNNDWYSIVCSNQSNENKIRKVNENLRIGDIEISNLIDIQNNLRENKKYIFKVLDELVSNNFKKRVVINLDATRNEKIIRTVLLLLPNAIAKYVSFNTNIKDKKGATGCVLCGMTPDANIKNLSDYSLVSQNCDDKYNSFYVNHLSKKGNPLSVNLENYKLNQQFIQSKDYLSCLDSMFVNPNDLYVAIPFFNYYTSNSDISTQINNETLYSICRTLLFAPANLSDLNIDKFYDYIINKVVIDNVQNVRKPIYIDFCNLIFNKIFKTGIQRESRFLAQLFEMLSTNDNLIADFSSEKYLNIYDSIATDLQDYLSEPNSLTQNHIERFMVALIRLIIKFDEQYSLNLAASNRFVNIFDTVFTSFENPIINNVINKLFEEINDVAIKYTLLKYICLTQLYVSFNASEQSQNEKNIMNYIHKIVSNSENVERNRNLYDLLSSINHQKMEWLEEYIIPSFKNYDDFVVKNDSFSEEDASAVIHQTHKNSTNYLYNNLDAINYETIDKIVEIYDKYIDDNVNDFYAKEQTVRSKINDVEENKKTIRENTSIINGIFKRTTDEFNKTVESLFTSSPEVNVVSDPLPESGNKINRNFKISIVILINLLVTIGLCIPAYIILESLATLLLISIPVMLLSSFITFIRFRKQEKAISYIIINILLSTYVPLLIVNIAIILLYYLY